MKGVDISHYQYGLTIRQIQGAGNAFAIIKVTEGTWLKDAAAFDFYREAYESGFPVGCYCYSHATAPEQAREEAQFLLDTINGFPMPCGVFLDIEEPEQLDLAPETLSAIAGAWCGVVGGAGYVPGIYGSERSLWAKLTSEALPSDCLVWKARYGERPEMPCDLWQSGDSGHITGFNGTVDTDEACSARFEAQVYRGYDGKDAQTPGDCPPEYPVKEVSAAFRLLAEYIQTEKFQTDFLTWIGGRHE